MQNYLKDLSASSVASSICGGRQWSWRLIKPNATGPDMFWPISRSYCFICPLCANRFKFWPCHVSTSQCLLHLATSRQAFLLNAMTLLAPTAAVAPTVGALTCPLCASQLRSLHMLSHVITRLHSSFRTAFISGGPWNPLRLMLNKRSNRRRWSKTGMPHLVLCEGSWWHGTVLRSLSQNLNGCFFLPGSTVNRQPSARSPVKR